MKFKLDENLPSEASACLRSRRHDAHSVEDEGLGGIEDSKLADVCKREGRVLLNLDFDFAALRSYPPSQFEGIIVLRLARQDKEKVLLMLPRVLELLRSAEISGQLWVVDEIRTRIRSDL